VDLARLQGRLDAIVRVQVEGIRAELEWVNSRLAELGDSEEDRLELLLLWAIRDHLTRDLEELEGLDAANALSKAVVKA